MVLKNHTPRCKFFYDLIIKIKFMPLESGLNMPPKEQKEKPKEIERKFLIKSLPEDLEKYAKKEIVQGYVAITPEGTEVRLRQKGKKYFQTVKVGAGKTRGEYEIEITKEQFEALWDSTEGKRVDKVRYDIPISDGLKIELDVYRGDLNGLYSAEVEFPDEAASNKFTPPDWFGKEVTEDKWYKNQNLATKGIPEENQ
jgi:CYTH domain-containing protein